MYLRGDIKIAPRDLTVPYNLGHSFNKVAYPMSVGLPAVASAVPSYINRTVLLCDSEQDWYNTLKELIKNPQLRNLVGSKSQKFVQREFSSDKIGEEYIKLMMYLLE